MKRHDGWILSLCEISGKRLVSSLKEKTLKVWDINNDILRLINTLQGHNDSVDKIIPLTKDIIASAGSFDKTIRVWDVNVFKEIQTLRENFNVYSILKLKIKDEMIAGGFAKSVSFWNTKSFKKEHTVECYNCDSLIELPDHCVAVSSGCSSTISVIDIERYIKESNRFNAKGI